MVEIALESPTYPRALRSAPKTCGVAGCHPHFGELLQGVFEVAEGRHCRLVRALVSLHMPYADGSVARVTLEPKRTGTFLPKAGRTGIHVRPAHFSKCEIAARLALDAFGMKNIAASLEVTTFVPESAGLGSSTTGVVATIRAAADAIAIYQGVPLILPPQLQARLAVAAEHACDSLMFDCTGTTILFAQRIGKVIRTFNGPLPQMRILGFDTGSGASIDTDRLPRARYSRDQIAAFGCALAVLERAIAEQSVDLAGRVATFSAITSETAMQNPLRKPKFDELLRIKEGTGSAGIVVAHSGTVAGLIYDPSLPDFELRLQEAYGAVARLGFLRLSSFSTPY
ncbi:uncharacterized protein involved in propanediol utilization [Bradyrhizobium sp. USDA 3686]|uniref:GHMP family kinase ATP-binding protein n=1 Tax=Bradyrhizobium canariense TaxID=255045 RepID=UPI0019583A18|nr:hypothetical protein [Bradyrhizobium canariense]MBM7487960.1 uncharacterized protein involved in propanediol utilization [Bradyrhizobium canariense]